MPSLSVGIEITEAVDRQLAHHDAIANQSMSTGITDAYLFKYGHPEYSKEEIRRMAIQPVTKLEGPGWEGDEAEQGWTKAIVDRIREKVQSSFKEGYQKFDRNLLIIYDNTVEQIGLGDAHHHLRAAVDNIKQEITQLPFEYIFVERERHYLKIDNEISQDSIVDLWS